MAGLAALLEGSDEAGGGGAVAARAVAFGAAVEAVYGAVGNGSGNLSGFDRRNRPVRKQQAGFREFQ